MKFIRFCAVAIFLGATISSCAQGPTICSAVEPGCTAGRAVARWPTDGARALQLCILALGGRTMLSEVCRS